MRDLLATLNDYDPGMLPALAETWGIASKSLVDDAIIPQLHRVMLDPQSSEAAWDKLDDSARAALQLLVSSARQRMKIGQFERFYGKIRKLGRAQIEKEQPHLQGQSIAETLYYRGFISEGYDKVEDNLIGFFYVPPDLAEALPLHKTSYEHIEVEESSAADLPSLPAIDDVKHVIAADTSIVDDLATLLAFTQANKVEMEDDGLSPQALRALMPHVYHASSNRLDFLLCLGVSAGLITSQDGRAYPRRDEARSFLSATRAEQIRLLALAWLESQTYRDLWHIPGLFPDDSGWSYDPGAARDAVMSLFAELLPEQGWASVNDLIGVIKDIEPDFQRPDGDFDSWYIRNAAGEFLNGFESWDAVEGSLIEFYLVGPMHWLGLVDIGEDVLRLTAYGRAFLEMQDWPLPPDQPQSIEIRNDGALLASRRVNRFERFQLARFARWEQAGDTYVYRLDAASIQRASDQGINAQHIQAFLLRQLNGKPIPIPIVKLLRNWQDGAKTTVSFESHIILRANNEEVLDKIFAMPAFRRHLGARLGPMSCIIREDQWQDLSDKLGDDGIEVDAASMKRGNN
ncbi:MAG: helicase-associated domain-containing protein [Chloroflexota bacterium]|nr:helicase-associated domain-containing protein [Chloroflexota bacterium]MDE2949715.1 helicase-associated domain-containing protein [Chloroflexota bacterium]